MLKDFDQLKNQLRELAEVINAFQSEAVQLRLVELILGQVESAEVAPPERAEMDRSKGRARRRARAQKPDKLEAAGNRVRPRVQAGKPGTLKTLRTLMGAGFFSQPRTIGAIV